MFAPTTEDDSGHSSHVVSNDPYDGNDDSGDMYDNTEPLILSQPSGNLFLKFKITGVLQPKEKNSNLFTRCR